MGDMGRDPVVIVPMAVRIPDISELPFAQADAPAAVSGANRNCDLRHIAHFFVTCVALCV
jgi:hypothetical protein